MTYDVLPLANTFKTSSKSTVAEHQRPLGHAAAGGGACSGLAAVGGYGTYYGDVITAAQSYLATDGLSNSQKVIIFASDGGANAKSSNMPSGKASNQCPGGESPPPRPPPRREPWVYFDRLRLLDGHGGFEHLHDRYVRPLAAFRHARRCRISPRRRRNSTPDSSGGVTCPGGAEPERHGRHVSGHIAALSRDRGLIPDNTT